MRLAIAIVLIWCMMVAFVLASDRVGGEFIAEAVVRGIHGLVLTVGLLVFVWWRKHR